MTKSYIKSVLQGVHKLDINSETLTEAVVKNVHDIKKNGQAHGRSDITLINQSTRGLALEMQASWLLGGGLNPNEFNFKDPETFAWDFEAEGTRFEVKNAGMIDKWFNFNLKEYKTSDNKTFPVLDTFLNNISRVDYILVGATIQDGDFYGVTYKWIIDASTFMKHMKVSRTNGGSTHYYHIPDAIACGDCVAIN